MRGIKQKIILNTTLVALSFSIVTTVILTVTARTITNATLMETLKPFAVVASQSVGSNLHIMADRIFMIADNPALSSGETTPKAKQEILTHAASGIEFVWLALYTPDGRLYTGDKGSPADISGGQLYKMMSETQNLVIDDTAATEQGLEITVGTPVFAGDTPAYYLVGSYKYDLLNDVISNIHIGHSGHALIINQSGRIVAHEDIEYVQNGQDIESLYADSGQLLDLFSHVKAGEVGAGSVSVGNDDTLVAYAPVRGVNWFLAILVPKSEFMLAANNAILLNILLMALLFLLSMFFIARFSGRISKSLGNVTGRIQKLAQGDLTSPVDIISTKDEAQTLSVSLRDTIADVSGYILKLRDALSKLSLGNLDICVDGEFSGDFIVMKESLNSIIDFLNELLRHLKHSAEELNGAAREVSESAGAVHASSEKQSESVARLVTETDSISRDIGIVDDHAKTARELMDQAMQKLVECDERMKNTLGAMENISKNAEEITKITKFMEDIAVQTNLLALNAGVEAARAGSDGKGFAVVAYEIRELASKSTESSKRTAEMIEHSQRAVAEGSEFANLTAGFLKEIAEISRSVSGITYELAKLVENEKGALENVSADISHISGLAQQNLVSSGEVSTLSGELVRQADDLQEMSGRFRLRPGYEEGETESCQNEC